mmetsp:Transcript_8747/g.15362  ORF Transcript_8747/g.15362 Transcript_8747/m.15362 type:complete len:102 (-) Transcript_8747:660-965(-)
MSLPTALIFKQAPPELKVSQLGVILAEAVSLANESFPLTQLVRSFRPKSHIIAEKIPLKNSALHKELPSIEHVCFGVMIYNLYLEFASTNTYEVPLSLFLG